MMKEKSSKITVQFRRPPTQILDVQAGRTELFTNRLGIFIQPDEGIHFGSSPKCRTREWRQGPSRWISISANRSAIKLFRRPTNGSSWDALNGDASLFARSDEIERACNSSTAFVQDGRAATRRRCSRTLPVAGVPTHPNELLGRDGRWWVQD